LKDRGLDLVKSFLELKVKSIRLSKRRERK
jgi:hypothetical protein